MAKGATPVLLMDPAFTLRDLSLVRLRVCPIPSAVMTQVWFDDRPHPGLLPQEKEQRPDVFRFRKQVWFDAHPCRPSGSIQMVTGATLVLRQWIDDRRG
jgi:hypothetical protein